VRISKVRRRLYRSASILGDVEAVSKGPSAMGRRVVRKSIWRVVGRLLRSLS